MINTILRIPQDEVNSLIIFMVFLFGATFICFFILTTIYKKREKINCPECKNYRKLKGFEICTEDIISPTLITKKIKHCRHFKIKIG